MSLRKGRGGAIKSVEDSLNFLRTFSTNIEEAKKKGSCGQAQLF